MEHRKKYTCYEYRQERQLLGLRLRLQDVNLTEKEKRQIKRDIKVLEAEIGID
jgi:hypothetical protein